MGKAMSTEVYAESIGPSTIAVGCGSEDFSTTPQDIVAELDILEKCEQVKEWWKRTSGMQTVSKWVCNYKKHPAGWAALLMIHGVPEVTGRLRSKVENYAVYSALFLSVSIGLLADPPNVIGTDCSGDFKEINWWLCVSRKRVY